MIFNRVFSLRGVRIIKTFEVRHYGTLHGIRDFGVELVGEADQFNTNFSSFSRLSRTEVK